MAQPSRWLFRLVGGAVSPRTRARTLSKALITAGVDSAEDAEPFLLQPLVSLGFTPVEARVVMKAYLSEERGADAAAAAPAVEEEAEDGPAASPSAAPADAKDAAPPKKRQRSIAAAFAGDAPDSEAGSEAPGTSTDGMAPADFPAVWREHYGGSLLTMNEEEMAPSAKVAGFDMDGCLIDTRSGRAFPTNANDWQLRFPGKLEARMRALRGDGYKLVVRSAVRSFHRHLLVPAAPPTAADWTPRGARVSNRRWPAGARAGVHEPAGHREGENEGGGYSRQNRCPVPRHRRARAGAGSHRQVPLPQAGHRNGACLAASGRRRELGRARAARSVTPR